MDESICPLDEVHTVSAHAIGDESEGLPSGAVLGGRYRIERFIGAGAMGGVYEATQLSMMRKVAVKVLSRRLMADAQGLKRFYREARAASRLRHPNIVSIHDFGVDDALQVPFMTMELVEGRSLRELIEAEAPVPVARACAILSQLARALSAAHAEGIVHRDLKPDNVMVGCLAGGEEHVTVLDFGIAKVLRPAGEPESLTASGSIIGTPLYMSPEQAQGLEVDARSDLYALGCILHELITGRLVFDAKTDVELMLKHMNAIAPPLPEIAAPALVELHDALLAKDPAARPKSASIVAGTLAELARGSTAADAVASLERGVPASGLETTWPSAPRPDRAMIEDSASPVRASASTESGVRRLGAWRSIAVIALIAAGALAAVWLARGPEQTKTAETGVVAPEPSERGVAVETPVPARVESAGSASEQPSAEQRVEPAAPIAEQPVPRAEPEVRARPPARPRKPSKPAPELAPR